MCTPKNPGRSPCDPYPRSADRPSFTFRSVHPSKYTSAAAAARGFGDIVAVVFGTTSSSRITARRPAARAAWRAATAYASEHDYLVPSELPGYFVDRYAFGMLRWPALIFRPAMPGFPRDHTARQRADILRRFLRPSHALGGWQANPEEPTSLSPFYGHLRCMWSDFAQAKALPIGLLDVSDATQWTWLDVFNDSVFYPRRPAIPGPVFADLIDDQDRKAARDQFGDGWAIDFYCFMQQVHESIHTAQTGEPLLNEVVQASLWIAFLDHYPELWVLQRNTRTGVCAVREIAAVSSNPWLADSAVASGLDTARLVDERFDDGTYFRCCHLANKFDASKIKYSLYLDHVSRLLCHAAHERAQHPASCRFRV